MLNFIHDVTCETLCISDVHCIGLPFLLLLLYSKMIKMGLDIGYTFTFPHHLEKTGLDEETCFFLYFNSLHPLFYSPLYGKADRNLS